MLLSIITINLNNSDGLQITINSLRGQTFQDFEYIVIDGGSTDKSLEVINQYSDCIDYWVSEKDHGIYDALNKGIKKSNAKYLMFLNSGDSLASSDILALCSQQITEYPSTDIFYGDTFFKSIIPPKIWIHKHPPVVDLWFLQYSNLNHQSSVIKKSLFDEFGLYPLKYKLAADHWLYLKSCVADKLFTHIDHPLAIYDSGGLSHTNYSVYKTEMNQIWQELVPEYVKPLIRKLNDFRLVNNYKMVKVAILINNKLQRIIKNKK